MGKILKSIQESKLYRNILVFFAIMGPGIITANVDNDAGGIATYSLAGAQYGYNLVWSLVPITIALVIVMEMCSRMAVATGKGLADLIRENYGVKVTFYLMVALFFVNLTNVMAEFAGVAASMEILGISKYISVPGAGLFVWWLVVKGTYRSIEKIFLFACLFYVAYVISGFMAKPDWNEVLRDTLHPQIEWNSAYLVMLVGLVGTTIAPWMTFYLQSSIVEKGVSVEEYDHLRLDVVVGSIIAPIVAFFIIVACAATLHKNGITIHSATEAALALKPLVGNYATILFSGGLFIASIFAASILPISTSYSICEGMGWAAGVDKRTEEAPQFFWLYAIMIILGSGVVLIPNFPLLSMMYLSQVGNGILLPIILVLMVTLINDKDIMGEFTNAKWLNIVTWITVGVIIVMTLIMLWYLFFFPETAIL